MSRPTHCQRQGGKKISPANIRQTLSGPLFESATALNLKTSKSGQTKFRETESSPQLQNRDSRENFSFVENRKKVSKTKTVETLKTAKNRTQLLMILFSSKITRTDVTFARSHTLSLFLPLSPSLPLSLPLSLSLSLSFFLSLQGLLLPIFFSSKRAWVALYLSATVATHRHLRTTCQRGFSSFEAAATAFEKLLSLSRSPARLRRLQRNLQ